MHRRQHPPTRLPNKAQIQRQRVSSVDASDVGDQYPKALGDHQELHGSPPYSLKNGTSLASKTNWLRIDMPPIEFVAALEQDYTVEFLTELGLYERVDDELRLPSWLDGDAPLYVTIDEDNGTYCFFPR